MARINKLQLENVRCFKEQQSARIGRITVLVGPNGSGKSTFLGCYKTLADLANLQDLEGKDLDDINHFDAFPFCMGAFETIARSGSNEFTIGGRFESHCHTSASFTFGADEKGNPLEQDVRIEFADGDKARDELRALRHSTQVSGRSEEIWQLSARNLNVEIGRPSLSYKQFSTWLSRAVRRGFLPDAHVTSSNLSSLKEKTEYIKFVNFFKKDLPLPEEPSIIVCPVAPTPKFPRQREYDSNPLSAAAANNKKIQDFGDSIGIWSNIKVQRDVESGAFKIMVKVPGGIHNLADVGYGVYSLLPFVDIALENKKDAIFLLQQPEVHLHGEAQANLGKWMVESGYDFIIETHSEHFIDRFRICVMKGLMKPEDLSIIYFDSDSTKTTMHSITVDEAGNLDNVPVGYRRFFADEANRLLGIG